MMKSRIILFFILLFICNNLFSQYQPKPGVEWFTLATDHFLVHFSENNLENARRIARKMENIHAIVSTALNHVPEIKTNVVVVDNADILFGGASYVFRNTIYINAVQIPVGIGHYGDFEHNVLLHEYVHILDLDMMDNIPLFLRMVIGRLYTHNMLCPNWMIEGYATYLETVLTNGGRGRDPYYDMYFRMAFLDDQVEGISTFSPVNDKWGSNSVPYIYGESLYRQMGNGEQGSKKVIEFRKKNSEKFIPFNFWGRFNPYWDGNLDFFYSEWKTTMNQRYVAQRESIFREGLTKTNQLTNHGFDTWGLTWSADDNTVFYIKSDYDSHQALMKYDLEKGKSKKLTNVNSLYSGLHLDTDQNLWFNQYNIYDKNSMLSGTYLYDLDRGRKRKVADQKRVLYSCTDTLGNLFFVRLEKGQTGLFMLDKNNGEEMLVPPSDTLFIANPEVSPDGRYITFDLWRQGGNKDIYLYDLAENTLLPLTSDKAWDISPTWNNEGDQVIFSSDRSGVYNLYAVDIKTKSIKRLTNVLGGAFCPDVSNSGNEIAFLGYSSTGFDVSTMKYPDINSIEPYTLPIKTGFHSGWEETGGNEKFIEEYPIGSVQNYNPLPGFIQNIRMPYMSAYDSSVTFGISVLGNDVLGRHAYQLDLSLDVLRADFSYYLMYQNSYFYPDITFFGGNQVVPVWVSNEDGNTLRGLRSKSYGLQVSVPLLKVDYALNAFGGFSVNETQNTDNWENKPLDVIEGKYNNLEAGISFSNIKAYRRSISIGEGIQVSGIFNRLIIEEARQKNIDVINGEVHKYTRIPFTKHHILYTGIIASKSNLTESLDQVILRDSLRSYGMIEWNQHIIGGIAEYRFPIFRIEKGISVTPVYFRKIFASVYSEYWEYSKNGYVQKIGLNGIELHLSTYLFYNFPVIITGGYQQPWLGRADRKKQSFYVGLKIGMVI